MNTIIHILVVAVQAVFIFSAIVLVLALFIALVELIGLCIWRILEFFGGDP